MFNLDARQQSVIRITAASTFVFWLLNQIADSGWAERLWGQLTMLAVITGVLRVFVLEATKPKRSQDGAARRL